MVFAVDRPLIHFFKTFISFKVLDVLDQNNLTSSQKYHKFLVLSIFDDDLCSLLKIDKKTISQ